MFGNSLSPLVSLILHANNMLLLTSQVVSQLICKSVKIAHGHQLQSMFHGTSGIVMENVGELLQTECTTLKIIMLLKDLIK